MTLCLFSIATYYHLIDNIYKTILYCGIVESSCKNLLTSHSENEKEIKELLTQSYTMKVHCFSELTLDIINPIFDSLIEIGTFSSTFLQVQLRNRYFLVNQTSEKAILECISRTIEIKKMLQLNQKDFSQNLFLHNTSIICSQLACLYYAINFLAEGNYFLNNFPF